MANTKAYTTPVWILVITAVIKALMIIFAIIAVNFYLSGKTGGGPHYTWYIPDFLLLLLILVQAFAYWVFRYKIFNKTWALVHVWLTVFVMMAVPIVITITSVFLNSYIRSANYAENLRIMGRLRLYIFWGLLVIANIFFVMQLYKSYRTEHTPVTDDIDAIGTE